MSKERELLEKTIPYLRNYLNGTISMKLADEIEELLAQPEPEPVVWQLIRKVGHKPPLVDYVYSKPREQIYQYYKVTELYKGSND